MPERLLAHPTLRLLYTSDRTIPHFETLPIHCDGRGYRVVRDENGDVHIYDDQDRRLANRHGQRTLRSSVFMRSDQEWCEEVRQGRGPDQ